MAFLLTLIGAAIVLTIVYFIQSEYRKAIDARKNGCQPATVLRPIEPFFALDFHVKTTLDIPSSVGYFERYGKTFQIRSLLGQSVISTIEPSNLEVILRSGKDWGIGPYRLPGMEAFCGRGFLTQDGKIWDDARRFLKPTFNTANIRDMSVLSNEVAKFVDDIPVGVTVDLQPMIFKIFLNTSLHFLLGVKADTKIDAAPCTAERFVDAFHDALFGTGIRIVIGSFRSILPKGKYQRDCATVHDFLNFFVDQSLAARKQQEDSPGLNDSGAIKKRSLIQNLAAQTDDRNFIRCQILQGMMAAQETTSSLLGNTLFLLARNPSYWQQIRADVLEKGEELCSFDGLNNYGFLKNILFESLRLYPVFPLLAREALKDTILPTGGGPTRQDPVFASKGTLASWSIYTLHREPSVFGADVESFNPERWNSIRPGQWEFLPFGGGQRACLGQQMALTEASFVLVQMAKEFEVLESRDDRPWKGDQRLTCKNANGCNVALWRTAEAR